MFPYLGNFHEVDYFFEIFVSFELLLDIPSLMKEVQEKTIYPSM